MVYRVVWKPQAREQLDSLPADIVRRIAKKVETYLVLNPRQLGTALLGAYSNLHRYRIGDYRVIYEIKDEEITIYIVRVGDRKDVYED